jgi:hypothetical protein
MADESLITIDADGDVILELVDKDGDVRLLVSPKVLRLVSPVFATMFKSRFKEGLDNARLSPEEPIVISLPEDDAEALTILCNVVHYLMEDVPRCLDPATLEKITILCDKYDCVSAVTHSSIVWLDAGLTHYEPGDHVKLLFAA